MPLITIPKPLRDKLGDEGSDALIAVLNEQEKETENSVIETAGLRFERKLAEEVSAIRVELAELETRFESKLTHEISGLREEMIRGDSTLAEAIHKSSANTIKWMFLFWAGQIGIVTALFLKVIQ